MGTMELLTKESSVGIFPSLVAYSGGRMISANSFGSGGNFKKVKH